MSVGADEPLGVEVTEAIRAGELGTLRRLLDEHPGLATARVTGTGQSRTLLHVATDWPGHFPNGVASVATLIEAGAEVDARFVDGHAETPLHWAASSDDLEVLDALIDAGADIEADGGVIAGGTPLDDAVAFGQWRAARRLVERDARTALWHAAALGLMDRIGAHFTAGPLPAPHPWGAGATPPPDEVTVAFWCACHGGQADAAAYLLGRGAELNWVSPWDGLTPLDAAVREGADELAAWMRSRGATSASSQT